MRKHLLWVVLCIVLVGFGTYLWLQPRPSADWYDPLSYQICPHDRTAVATVVQIQTDQYGGYNGASLAAYNQYGELIVSGNVEVVWRRAWQDPLTNHKAYTGSYLTADRDLFYGVYSAEAVKRLEAGSTGPEMIQIDSQGKPMYYKGLAGTSVANRSIVPISALTGASSDRQKFALGLVAAGDNNRVVTCQRNDGGVESVTYGNTLQMLEDAGGGGRILFTDAVLTGTMTPVDNESHQFRISRAGEFVGTDFIIPPQKGPLYGSVIVDPGVELLTFSSEKTGRYWWLALQPRPSGPYNIHVTGLNQYADDWNTVSFTRTAQAAAAMPNSFMGIDPMAVAAFQATGIPVTPTDQYPHFPITQGLGNASASAGTHGHEPGSPYSASIDIKVEGLDEATISDWVHRLRMVGFAAFYRPTIGDFPHIHAVYAGVCRLKDSTDAQVHSFVQGHNGLVGDPVETNLPPTNEEKQAVARIYGAAFCSGDLTPQTTVAQQGSGNTLHAMLFMDAMYSQYFGRFYPDGYYGGLPIGHWDVSYDRGRIIPPEAFLYGLNGKTTIPITGAFPPAVPDDCTEECMPTGLKATYGVYMLTGPWQDALSSGYTQNGSFPEYKIAEFTYDFDHPDNPIEIDYHLSSLTENERRLGYKWGVALALIGNNDQTGSYNEVVYMQQVFTNSIQLPGEPIGTYFDYMFGDSGIIRITNEGDPYQYNMYPVFISDDSIDTDTTRNTRDEVGTDVLPVDDEDTVDTMRGAVDDQEQPPTAETPTTDTGNDTNTDTAVVDAPPVVVPAVVLPEVPVPSTVETLSQTVATVVDTLVAVISPDVQDVPILDLRQQAALQLADAKARVTSLTQRQKELTRTLTAARRAKDKEAIRNTNKLLTAAKRAVTLSKRTYTAQNRAYSAFVRAQAALSSLRARYGDNPNRTQRRKLVVAERQYQRTENTLRKLFTLQ